MNKENTLKLIDILLEKIKDDELTIEIQTYEIHKLKMKVEELTSKAENPEDSSKKLQDIEVR